MMERGLPLLPHVSLPMEADLVAWLTGELSAARPGARDFSDLAVVFPGRRPALYLRRALGAECAGPYLPPRVFDVDGFMAFVAQQAPEGEGRREPTQIEALHLLHGCLKGAAQGHEAADWDFEAYFSWGLRLLRAFDEFGAELVAAERLGQGVQAALRDSGLSDDVRGLWPVLPALYAAWQEALAAEGLWSRGEKVRIAAEHIERFTSPFSGIVLAGFVGLNRAEAAVLSALTRAGAARVVIQEGEGRPEDPAGDPLTRLRGACVGPWSRIEAGAEGKGPSVSLHQAGDLHGQIALARKVMAGARAGEGPGPEETVVVLPRPEPLLPALNWLIEEAGVPYNVSMGYPLERTPAARLLSALLDAEEGRVEAALYVPHYLSVLRHPFVRNIPLPPGAEGADGEAAVEGRLQAVLRRAETWLLERRLLYVEPGAVENWLKEEEGAAAGLDLLRRLHAEALEPLTRAGTVGAFAGALRAFLRWVAESGPAAKYPLSGEFLGAMTGFLAELEEGPLCVEPVTPAGFRLLFRHLVRERRIPFAGVPLEGLQVLGFLETRGLAFRRVLVLDMNEDVLPPSARPDPLLPPDLRAALGLPDQRGRVAISRHYLERLMAGAEEVHLFYAEGGEALRSRFVEEFVWRKERAAGGRGALPANSLPPARRPSERRPFRIEKRGEVAAFLQGFTFSPSALDTYLACPVRFYARYVLGLEEAERLGPEIDPALVGTAVHEALGALYAPWQGKTIRFEDDAEARLILHVDAALGEAFGGEAWSESVRLFREVLLFRLAHFLRLDRTLGEGRTLLGVESEVRAEIGLPGGARVRLKGRLDRVERDPKGTLWVIDYKTGEVKLPRARPGEPAPESRREMAPRIVSFQLPVYLLLADAGFCGGEGAWERMNAALYALKGLSGTSGHRALVQPLFGKGAEPGVLMEEVYRPALWALLSEILDPAAPFSAEPADPGACAACDFRDGPCLRG